MPLWRQRAAHEEDGVTVWDYHVVVAEHQGGSGGWLVWDLDRYCCVSELRFLAQAVAGPTFPARLLLLKLCLKPPIPAADSSQALHLE